MSVTVTDNSDAVRAAFDAQIAIALEAMGLLAEGDAVEICPKRTGHLAEKISHSVDAGAKEAYVGTNVEYGPHVEFGTRYQKAQPFLKPAVAENGEAFKQIAERYMKNG